MRSCSRQRSLVKQWLKVYDSIGVKFDQAALREALWWSVNKRKLRMWVLPSEYNLRTPKPWLTGAGIAVKILHGRLPEEKRISLHNYLNNNINFRASSEFNTGQNQEILPHH